VQQRLDKNPQAMRVRRDTVEHPFGTLKLRMGATRFLMKTLPRVATEMAPHVLAYNLTRVMNILGIQPLMAGDEAVVTASQLSLKDRTHRELALLQWQSVNASARTFPHNQDPKRTPLCIASQTKRRGQAPASLVLGPSQTDALRLQLGSFERSTAAPRRITCEILRVLVMSSMGFASSTISRRSCRLRACRCRTS
jgi:hypothetical protein